MLPSTSQFLRNSNKEKNNAGHNILVDMITKRVGRIGNNAKNNDDDNNNNDINSAIKNNKKQ